MNRNLGSQFHPNVDHYRDGGMGGVGEDHSVVGMVPTHVLKNYQEYDRTDDANHPGSRERIEARRADLRSGEGFHTPLMLLYDHKNHWAKLGEGNHRLAAAEAEGIPHVPTRVVRANLERDKAEGVGAPATHNDPGWSRPGWDYVPSDIHPSYLNLTEDQQ